MKCPYCGRDVTPIGANCPRCKAKIVRPVEKKTDPPKEENGGKE